MSEKVSLKELKDQAFKAPIETVEKAVKGAATGQRPVKDDLLDFELPVAVVPLPSRGKVYPPESPLYDVSQLEVRAMNAYDENILSSNTLIRKGKMMSTLIRSCVTNRDVDPDEMLVGDRNAVMVAIRNSSYGPHYPAEVACPSCEVVSERSFDLSRIPIIPLEIDPVAPGVNLFEFSLPVTKKKVLFRLTTGAIEAELQSSLEALAKAHGPGAIEEDVTQRMLSQIASVDGVEDKGRIARFVKNMPVLDSRELRGYIGDISPGIDMQQVTECPACGRKDEVAIPFGAEFFWPSTGKRARGRG